VLWGEVDGNGILFDRYIKEIRRELRIDFNSSRNLEMMCNGCRVVDGGV